MKCKEAANVLSASGWYSPVEQWSALFDKSKTPLKNANQNLIKELFKTEEPDEKAYV